MAEHLKDLEGRPKGEDGKNQPREFFWDSIVLVVVFSIIGLTAVDVISEYVRGSTVECFAVLEGLGSTTDPESYINNFCADYVSVSQYFPVFMIVHAILIGIPHYLWLNHYGGSFEFFFQLTSSLERLRDYEAGEYSEKNYLIVEQLDDAFAVYKRNWMFYLYVAKLTLQWLLTVAGFIVAIVFFTDFNTNFLCPQTLNETFEDPMWLLPNQQANCVFASLRLIELIRVADLVLLAAVVLGLTWSLMWCASTHSSELGTKDVAKFSFQSGLAPKYYVPKLPVPRCCKGCRNTLHKLFTSIPWFSIRGPRIKTDLDFMVMKLFRTDGGLGHVLREVQIYKEIKSMSKDERRRFHLHKREQSDAERGALIDLKDAKADLKWTFENIIEAYDNFKSLNIMSDTLVLPDSLRGAVLGYATLSTENTGALYIGFGSPSLSLADAIARVFDMVGCFNFSSYYNNPAKPVLVEADAEGIVTVTCSEDYLTGDTKDNSQTLLNKSEDIWKDYKKSKLIVIGVMDKISHKSTMSYFLEQLSVDHIADDAILLCVKPLKIAGKTMEDDTFYTYTPPEKHFESESHQVEVKYSNGKPTEGMDWTAVTEDGIKTPKQPKSNSQDQSASQTYCCYSRGEESLLVEETSTKGSGRKKSAFHNLVLLVGNAHGEFQFSLYTRKASKPDNTQQTASHSIVAGAGMGGTTTTTL